jgi:hypothetical protein
MAGHRMPERPDLSTIDEAQIVHHLHGLALSDFERLLKNDAFGPRHLVSLLRDPAASPAVLRRVYEDDDLHANYRVKVALVQHPKLPRPVASELLRHLFWRDLAVVIDNARVHAQVRRTAEYLLEEQVEALRLGEKLSLARLAGRSVIRMLRKEHDLSVVNILLTNSRLTEEDVLFMITRSGARPDVLTAIGRSGRWSQRNPVKLALARNPATPPSVTLGFLSGLLDRDLKGLIATPTVPHIVRRTAQRILTEGRSRR